MIKDVKRFIAKNYTMEQFYRQGWENSELHQAIRDRCYKEFKIRRIARKTASQLLLQQINAKNDLELTLKGFFDWIDPDERCWRENLVATPFYYDFLIKKGSQIVGSHNGIFFNDYELKQFIEENNKDYCTVELVDIERIQGKQDIISIYGKTDYAIECLGIYLGIANKHSKVSEILKQLKDMEVL